MFELSKCDFDAFGVDDFEESNKQDEDDSVKKCGDFVSTGYKQKNHALEVIVDRL